MICVFKFATKCPGPCQKHIWHFDWAWAPTLSPILRGFNGRNPYMTIVCGLLFLTWSVRILLSSSLDMCKARAGQTHDMTRNTFAAPMTPMHICIYIYICITSYTCGTSVSSSRPRCTYVYTHKKCALYINIYPVINCTCVKQTGYIISSMCQCRYVCNVR